MSKKDLQKTIIDSEGLILSDYTLNLNHLLASAYDLIIQYNLLGNPNSHIQRHTIRQDILKCFKFTDGFQKGEELFRKVYYGEAEVNEHSEYSPYYVWEDVTDYFNNIAPNGYYFGSSAGDGACIGWFQNEEYEE